MVQETAASMTAPEGAIWQAWLDAFIHPKFETYARWYLRMDARWRRISLAVSLPLLLIAILVIIAHDAVFMGNSFQTLTQSRFLSYLGSPHSLFELCDLFVDALVALVAIPAIAALITHRSIGRYHVRLYIAYCTFMQTLPMTCVFLVIGAVGYFVFSVFNFDSAAFIGQVAGFILVYMPTAMAFGIVSTGLSAATLRFSFYLYSNLTVIAIYIAIAFLVWHLLGQVLVSFGYPVL